MKIRNRIALWITFAGILSSLVLSLIIFFEMLATPYELLDQELDGSIRSLTENIKFLPDGTISFGSKSGRFSTPYWIRIYDGQHHVLFESEMVKKIDLPLRERGKGYTVDTEIPMNQIIPGLDDDELAGFRVKAFVFSSAGQDYLFQIARPVENLSHEVIEQLITIGIGLAVSALFLILVSYYVAGRILRPIREINSTAHEITEKTLDKRIPLGRNRDELYELSSSLNSMFDRLQFSFIRQKEFIANASHELKTPITMLRLSLEEALQQDGLPEPYQQRVELQNKTLLRMNRLVKNLLDLSALELSETCNNENFSLNELIESVVEDFQPLIHGENINLMVQMDDACQVRADREKIKRICINLFDNAIKYNQQDGEVRLQVVPGKEDRNVRISLFNTGPGVPVEDRERIFEQFYRVEKSRSTALGGSGLGLTIVKRIVDLHGGKISVQSKLGKWIQFDLDLPILTGSSS